MIEAENANYPIKRMCVWAGVSESGFYQWRRREPSPTAIRRKELAVKVKEIFEESDKTHGRRRVTVQLNQDGIDCSERLVSRVMAENNMVSCHTPKFKSLTKADGSK